MQSVYDGFYHLSSVYIVHLSVNLKRNKSLESYETKRFRALELLVLRILILFVFLKFL